MTEEDIVTIILGGTRESGKLGTPLYFNIEYHRGQYHLFIDGVSSTSIDIDEIKNELGEWGESHE